MPTQLNRKLAITFLFSLAILLALAGPSSANGISPDTVRRRDHANLNRMIKIRAPSLAVPRQVAPDPGVDTSTLTNASPSSTPTTTSSSPTPTDTPQSSTPPPSSQTTSSSTSSSPAASVSSTLSPSSGSPTSSTPTPTTTPSTPSAQAPAPTTSGSASPTVKNPQQTAVKGQSQSVDSVTLTSHVPAASSASANNSQIGASSLSHTTITILIVLAASIGGCAIIWTIIRKWKFRPSAQFEDRLEPVNWQPTEHDSGLPTHRRANSDASSFHSAGHDNMGLSRSNSGGAYNGRRSLTPLPDHDFTAGAATLAPVGGYADLTRGPSPQPQMQEALQRGPSFNRGYENYTGPAPPQEAYDYNHAGAGY